ncbi:MAG: hypothetical protein L3I99_05565 [Sulfurimonas sp.]|nr:hypothetical protein [Sulfurimonas sp.]
MHNVHYHNKNNHSEKQLKVKNIGKIKRETTCDLFGILLFKQETLDQIFKDSGHLAKDNEFQFHYTALIGTATVQNQRLKISIPLVCYNYKQTISTASVKFNLEDVENISDEIMNIAQMNTSKFKESDSCKELVDLFGITEWEVATLQSMHRHPGGSNQGFSGTDLQDNPENPGVVFPFSISLKQSTSFSSIMYIDNNEKCRLAHTEIYSVQGSTVHKDGIMYSKGRSVSIVSGYNKTPTKLESMFGISGLSCQDTVYEDEVNISKELKKSLIDIMSKSDFMPDVFIDSSYLSDEDDTVAKRYNFGQGTCRERQYGNSSETLFSKDDIVYDSDNVYDSKKTQYAYDIDALEQDDDGCYINKPEELDEFDQDLLTESIRQDLTEYIYAGTKIQMYSDYALSFKSDEEIWGLARTNNLLLPFN